MFAPARQTRQPRIPAKQHVALPRNAGYFFPAAPAAEPRSAGAIDDLARALADQSPPRPDRAPIPALYADWAELVARDIGCLLSPAGAGPGRPRETGLPASGNGRLDLSPIHAGSGRAGGWLAEALDRAQRRLVTAAPAMGLCAGTAEAASAWARRQIGWSWQWLVLNQFLPTVVDDWILAEVVRDGAPLYRQFRASLAPGVPGALPVPLEVSCAAFGFIASMARPGRPGPGMPGFALSALRVPDPMVAAAGIVTGPAPGLARMVSTARRIDTCIAATRDAARPAAALARDHLCAGLRVQLPSAQACLDGLEEMGIVLPRLSPDELASGSASAAIRAGRFHEDTPLWFYILKEAELREHGARLGALGSRLVAETLVGIVQCDPTSYWQAGGSDAGRWHPNDGPKPLARPLSSLEEILHVAHAP